MFVVPPELVFLDANVIFSAAIGSKTCRSIVRIPQIKLLTSDYCLAEVTRNLTAKGYDPAIDLHDLLTAVTEVQTPPQSYWQTLAPLLPPRATTDLPILGAALVAHADVLITGNTRDFGDLMKKPLSAGPTVLTPRAFLERGPRGRQG